MGIYSGLNPGWSRAFQSLMCTQVPGSCLNAEGLCGRLSGKESAYQSWRLRRLGFDPWGGTIPWRRKWQPTPVFWPGESHGQRSLVGYSPWGRKELDTTERLNNTNKLIPEVWGRA